MNHEVTSLPKVPRATNAAPSADVIEVGVSVKKSWLGTRSPGLFLLEFSTLFQQNPNPRNLFFKKMFFGSDV